MTRVKIFIKNIETPKFAGKFKGIGWIEKPKSFVIRAIDNENKSTELHFEFIDVKDAENFMQELEDQLRIKSNEEITEIN
jgi:hypothetical protein